MKSVQVLIGLVGLPEEQGRRAVGGDAVLGKEMWISSGDDPVRGEEAGVTVIGMDAVTLPGIVAEDDRGPDPAYIVGDQTP